MTSTEEGEEWNAVTGDGGLSVLAYATSLSPRLVSFYPTQRVRVRVSHSLYLIGYLGGRPLPMRVPSKILGRRIASGWSGV